MSTTWTYYLSQTCACMNVRRHFARFGDISASHHDTDATQLAIAATARSREALALRWMKRHQIVVMRPARTPVATPVTSSASAVATNLQCSGCTAHSRAHSAIVTWPSTSTSLGWPAALNPTYNADIAIFTNEAQIHPHFSDILSL